MCLLHNTKDRIKELIFSSIKKGHPEVSMPAWEGALTDEQIQALVDYILQQEQ